MIAKNVKMSIPALLMMIVSLASVNAQDLSGAWKLISDNGKAPANECIKIYSDNYFMFAARAADGAFVKAGGGNYKVSGKEYTEVPDFNTSDSTQVRKTLTYAFSIDKDRLTLTANGKVETWHRADDSKTPLSGAWRFGARVNDEGIAGDRRGAASPRQTMKILSGKYFQWAAFNYETRQMSGTGGGGYEFKDNQYTETIRFFSRDNSRVGKSLTFECKIDGSDWYHKGKGTTGNPVSEVWEKVK